MNEKQVVIIGAGMAGLTAAAYLARAGMKVQVYEKHMIPGGYVSSFHRKGFRFPTGPSMLGSNGIVFPILSELGLLEKEQFVATGHQISWGSVDIPLRNPSQTSEALIKQFPGEAENLKRYFEWVEIGSTAFNSMALSGLMFGQTKFTTLLRLITKHPLSLWAFAKTNRQTNISLHNTYFKNGFLRSLLNTLGYPVMTGKCTLGMWSTYYWDSWIPNNGMIDITERLIQYIQERGGVVQLGCAVSKINLVEGSANGVELITGEVIEADEVISAADLQQTCTKLIDSTKLPETMMTKLRATRPSESMFTIYLGLKGSELLSRELKRFQESHVVYTCPDGNYIKLVLLSKDDPKAAPVGKHAMMISMLSSYDEWTEAAKDKHTYKTKKSQFTEDLISRAVEFLPSLREHIEVQDAASPLTNERYTSNWQGGTSGWSWDPEFAPKFDYAKDLPIKNLSVVGHYVSNPGGVPAAMITSWYIAKNIIEKNFQI
jgi:prolycopene isomerase